jgi:hypothetical protein
MSDFSYFAVGFFILFGITCVLPVREVQPVMASFNKLIDVGTDDCEESSGGTYSDTVDKVRLQRTGNFKYIGWRFTNVTIPQGSVIDAADVDWHRNSHDCISGAQCTVFINGVDVDDAAVWSSGNKPSVQTLTTANKLYLLGVSDVTVLIGCGTNITQDVQNIIQEIIDRSGWSSGNALSIVLRAGSGPDFCATCFIDYDMYDKIPFLGSEGDCAAELIISYTPPALDEPAGGFVDSITRLGLPGF